ncbi:Hypothetical protein LUCI_4020 [Lucifera butyrica]|uniref:Ecf transporter substrate-specific component n=1 Tax=Lucifera butyrica TaxID=1351585 RepID=A0A498RF64_9FIRM|nr:hypothetical protein [Lucifera butyrica]VBB08742.1 Hypothetical protein LUCI_4020 [Lucifera butyrica]
MQGIDSQKLTRLSLLAALALLFQSLRFILPIPVFFSTFLIGSLVNAVLLVSVYFLGIWETVLIACITPLVAYFQQLLPLPVFIIPIAIGNTLYAGMFHLLKRQWLGTGIAAIVKTLFLWESFRWLMSLVAIPPKMAAGILFIMSWPQLVTGILGGMLAILLIQRLKLSL